MWCVTVVTPQQHWLSRSHAPRDLCAHAPHTLTNTNSPCSSLGLIPHSFPASRERFSAATMTNTASNSAVVTGSDTVKQGLAQMFKVRHGPGCEPRGENANQVLGPDPVLFAFVLQGGVIMDVVNAEQARIAEEAGACAVMALERVPADIRKDGKFVPRRPLG